MEGGRKEERKDEVQIQISYKSKMLGLPGREPESEPFITASWGARGCVGTHTEEKYTFVLRDPLP